MAYWILKVVLSPVFHLLWRVKVEGRENVPTHGPAVLAANHQSFCDSFFLPLALRRRLTYVAKAEYFDNWRTAWFFRASGQIPMQRGGGDASQRALDTATEVLQAGGLLGIYPEGTRAPDVRLHRGHTGVARLALRCDVPIIPVGLVGTRAVQPPGSLFMRPFHSVTIRFGPPMASPCPGETMPIGPSGEAHHGGGSERSTNGSADGSTNGSADGSSNGSADGSTNGSADTAQEREQVKLREMTDALMSEIARLSGQEYVDLYATRVKAG
jgi:1-acyl-sn-glycerol-3-phosphate acyltransferase